MQAIKTIGLDIAKSVFQVHGVDADGQVVIRPDQYVAWRGNNSTDSNRLFAQVVGKTA